MNLTVIESTQIVVRPSEITRHARNFRMADDQTLIAACRAGDGAAWEEVHRRYHRLVRSIAVSYGASSHDADEVVQIAFSILHRSIEKIAADSRLAPWLSVVARRHTWRILEARRREQPTVLADTSIHHDEVSDGPEFDDALREALRLLPPRCRVLLEALYLRGDDPAYLDVSSELGIPIGSIGPTRSRCLERLRALVMARVGVSTSASSATVLEGPE